MAKSIKIAQFGLGPIGMETLKLAAGRRGVEVIGAVDVAPAKRGQDLGFITGNRALRGCKVFGLFAELLRSEKPDLVFHTTVSGFQAAYGQIQPLARHGISVVSSCEELLFPQRHDPVLAARLDRLCRQTGARVVGTGVNPGFVMDVLPLCLTGVCSHIRAIHIQRVVNASTRREPLQRKIGSGWPPSVFRRRFKAGEAGHAGLCDSLALIAHCLGWKINGLRETGAPVIATHKIRTRFLEVEPGETRGLHQHARASRNGKTCLTLDLKMYLDAPNPHDAIQIEGEPPLDLLIRGGVAGDQATAAALVNTAPRLLQAAPGLRLMSDLALPRAAAED